MGTKEQIYKRAKDIAKQEVKDSNKLSGWESIEDAASVLVRANPIEYLVLAIVDYLDDPSGIRKDQKENKR